MDYHSTLSAAVSYFGSALNHDDVFIMDQLTFMQMFSHARPISLKVSEPSTVMKHPLEDGATISDHMVIDPVKIDIDFIFIKGYKNTKAQFRAAFELGKLFTIKTKAKAYANMVLTQLPHEEDSSYANVIKATLSFEEARFVVPLHGELSASDVKNSKDASTVRRGAQQTTPASQSDTNRATSAYNGTYNNGASQNSASASRTLA